MKKNQRRRPRLKRPYKNLFPPLSHEEYDALRDSIRERGVLNPVLVTDSGKLIDGHHRLKIDPHAPRRVISGLTHAEQEALAIVSNTGRRNLSPAQRKEMAATMRAVAFKLRAEDPKKNTQQRIGKLLGVSRECVAKWLRPSYREPTVRELRNGTGTNEQPDSAFLADARFTISARVRPEIVRRHLAGETHVRIAADFKVAPSTLGRIIAKHERDEQAARKAEQAAAEAEKFGDLGVVTGDYRVVGNCIADASADLVLTDPPYAQNDIEQYAHLGRFAARVLKPGGSLVTYIPDHELPTVLSLVMESGLHFWWPLVVQHGGRSRVLDKYGVAVKSRLLLWFTRGGQRARRSQVDTLIPSRPDKRYHPWGQGVAETKYLIEKVTAPGGLVVDPYCGGGTVCVAAT